MRTHCESCGAPVETKDEKCAYCGTPYTWKNDPDPVINLDGPTFCVSLVSAGMLTLNEARRRYGLEEV